jgi:surface carbohydrate biosynthesis protein (TIGR04326 family)
MKLWVLWKMPKQTLPAGVCVLSFLLPADEEMLDAQPGVRLLRGRELSFQVRPAALELYRELVARIGTAPVRRGRTFRQAMTRPGGASLWWFHPVAFRDSEGSPIFGWIIQTLTVRQIAHAENVTGICLVGAPPGVAEVLRGVFAVDEIHSTPVTPFWMIALRGMAARLLFLFTFLRRHVALVRFYRAPTRSFDFVFSSFWDWSVKWDAKTGGYSDRYFKRVPQLLAKTPDIAVGHFAWFDPHFEPAQQGRALADVLAPLRGRDDVVLLQSRLGPVDAFAAALNLKPLSACMAALRRSEFRRVFVDDGLDWLPVFRSPLLSGCLNAHIPHCVLVALATERAARVHRPRLSLSFLEHFPYARAHYEGMRHAGVGTENWAMQHAGCCREKTFYFLHPRAEFAGEPDGCRVPTPDRVFAMGSLGRDIFLECGYAPAQVTLSGSARYDHIRFDPATPTVTTTARSGPFHVLVACSLEVSVEIAMVEAVCIAARPLVNIVLRVRNHPTSRVDAHPRFVKFRGQVEVSTDTLDTDLGWADLILFSYSTVADEAYLQGKPAWQWQPLGFNGSALVVAIAVPQFGSVQKLREALVRFCAQPDVYRPETMARREVAERLFHPADGRAAERIADECVRFISTSPRT